MSPCLVSPSQDILHMYTSGSVICDIFTQKGGLLVLFRPCSPRDSHPWRWCRAELHGLPSGFAGFHPWLSQHFFTWDSMGAWVVCSFCNHTCHKAYP